MAPNGVPSLSETAESEHETDGLPLEVEILEGTSPQIGEVEVILRRTKKIDRIVARTIY